MKRRLVIAALVALSVAMGAAAPANACLPYDGSCGYIDPNPHTGGPGWIYGDWYAPGYYYNHWWPGGRWYGYW